MDFENLRKLIGDSVYTSTLESVAEKTYSKIDERTNSTILNIALDDIRCSTLKEDVFYHHLEKDNADLVKFCVTRINGFKGSNTEQEYQEGEDQEEDDEVLERGGLAVIALVGFIIEFHYLSNNDDKRLTQYLKKIRMPKAAQHKAQLKQFFEKLS